MFGNKLGILIDSAFFEKDLRKHHNRRCDYRKLLEFLSCDQEGAEDNALAYNNFLNNETRLNDVVRAIYVTSQTVFRGNGQGLEDRKNDAHDRFLNALRNMNYEVDVAYYSIDAHFVLRALQLAQSGTVDTMLMLGLTVDHVPTLWAVRSLGIRVIGMFADAYHASERIKQALDWYYQIKVEDGFLTDELPSRGDDSLEEDDVDDDAED